MARKARKVGQALAAATTYLGQPKTRENKIAEIHLAARPRSRRLRLAEL